MGRKKTYNQLTTEQFQEKVHKFYPNIDIISKYINDSGKILPRRFTGTCAKHQRCIAEQVKLARFMGFIPYSK